MSKRVPCNECREHKRGCSGEMPCQRCQRFNLECVYTVNKSPKDEEYIQELELRQQMETLRDHMATMEKELDFLRVMQPTLVTTHQTSPFSKSSTFTSTSDTTSTASHGSVFSPQHYTEQDSPSTTASDLSDEQQSSTDNGKQLIARNKKGYSVTVESTTAATGKAVEPLDWTLTVNNGKFSIQTNIHNHNELFSSLQKIVSTLEFQDKVPALFENSTEPSPIGKALRFFMWRRYGKSRYKSMARSQRLLLLAANTRSSAFTQYPSPSFDIFKPLRIRRPSRILPCCNGTLCCDLYASMPTCTNGHTGRATDGLWTILC
ncbi:hypothetical protein BDB00DRAFT_364351 [Zychaea mexicana]|uniref:uncharacterized protein n=1 Tax=Zychaea mexicana TaxID=64656 RepID=UPI0022FF0039|nr:uncharacterized protein BDB00DRAFT_364351 [Zychaea mexicana]KAI9493512.1 hypothetical protein BDB00DRAFT_364351 [Zychaea mexicana]